MKILYQTFDLVFSTKVFAFAIHNHTDSASEVRGRHSEEQSNPVQWYYNRVNRFGFGYSSSVPKYYNLPYSYFPRFCSSPLLTSQSTSPSLLQEGFMEKQANSQETEKAESMECGKEQPLEEEEAEYVLLDLDNIAEHISIPPNTPYELSGLDTLNPILTIDNKIKLIGEYVETIGTCLVFNESGEARSDQRKTTPKQVNPMTSLNKVLKFRLFIDANGKDGAEKQGSNPS